ncbi:C2 domain containing protein [Nitzschia inconspicua]|uniref:C2 domain containing protein n=1 Tax=Nitzschia inconspicua TaxID=303405 RepID=A0A9K3K9B5_9STRA|nr:C2 domain containing protein [Nitzschia inconspicua]KAG7356513.1 C2 domain containing protein [Nitzschia inconspicua]
MVETVNGMVTAATLSTCSFDTDPSTDATDNDEFVSHGQNHAERQNQSSWLSRSLVPAFWAMPTFTSLEQSCREKQPVSSSRIPRQPSSSDRRFSSHNNQDKSPSSLEGSLAFRRGRSTPGSSAWKNVYVVLNLTDGGSLTCFREKPVVDKSIPRRNSFLRQRRKSRGDTRPRLQGASLLDHVSELVDNHNHDLIKGTTSTSKEQLRLHIGENVCWIGKDIQSSETEFIIEVPSEGANWVGKIGEKIPQNSDSSGMNSSTPHRLYFKCARHVEKIMWLQAMEGIDRLSKDVHAKRGMQTYFTPTITVKHRRTRTQLCSLLAQEGTRLFADDDTCHEDDPRMNRALHRMDKRGEKEYLVYPTYAYPNRWMTERELHVEMLKPSETFHDLRVLDGSSKNGEIGVLRVEALECVGLPVLDLASETDAVVYFVCGSYAFTTDVIWNRLNPKWLPKSRRACVIPIYHAYARLFAGVFDDDGKHEKDDFAGRVVIELSRLRPRSTYDVTLPLRMSSQVYSRVPRGSLRLRFSLEWHSERAALLSYIPRTIRPPTKHRPKDDVTVLCADEKAFRNIAMTVHGVDMPGKFSPQLFKACMRELNFTRKVAMNTIRDLSIELLLWRNPVVSGMVFWAWIHCVHNGSLSLMPCYVAVFLVLAMMRTYALYGSDGPIQQGFIPPSFEEMLAVLIPKRTANAMSPIQLRTLKSSGKRSLTSANSPNKITRVPLTHQQQGKWLFRLFDFSSDVGSQTDPEHYDMEFPFSQGLRDPITGDLCYRKFGVHDSLVVKAKGNSLARSECDDSESALDDILVCPLDRSTIGDVKSHGSYDGFLFSHVKKRKSKLFTPLKLGASFRSEKRGGSQKQLYTGTEIKIEDLPPRLRYPNQDIHCKEPSKKKNLSGDLDELRDNIHKLSFHLFNDRTHIPPSDGALHLGATRRSEKSAAALKAELERLLNIGPYSSSNPVIARIGLYLEPIVDSLQSILAISRVVYNVLTWRDPMLSFWVTILFMLSSILLFFFPWRLVFFIIGLAVLGPQNWALRVLHEKGMAPNCVSKVISSLKPSNEVNFPDNEKKEAKLADAIEVNSRIDQPIVSCHSNGNSAPLQLSQNNANPCTLYQVCVPYSQLNGTQRFYDWPPDPQYAKCTSNSHSFQ